MTAHECILHPVKSDVALDIVDVFHHASFVSTLHC